MKWSVEFLDAARRAVLDLPERIRHQVSNRIVALQENPFPPGVKKMQGYEGFYRIRSGDYRIIYRVVHQKRLIEIVRVRHRQDAYRRM